MKLEPGVMIGPYQLLTELSTRDAGTSRWGFATRDGIEYFIKQHTSPRYPMPGSGSEAVMQRRMDVCRAFEQRKQRLKRELHAVASDGTIVNVHDVFRVDASYYTITPKIDVAGLSAPEIARLTFQDRRVMMATAANALAALHTRRIVHADVKLTNVLVRRTERSYAARLIDFDSAYFEDDVPAPDAYGGTPEYFSPEALLYLQGKSTAIPGTSVDVFALGLIFCEWITTRKPATTAVGARSVAEGLINGGSPVTPTTGSDELDAMLAAMLDVDPAARPTMFEVKNTLRTFKDLTGAAHVASDASSAAFDAVASTTDVTRDSGAVPPVRIARSVERLKLPMRSRRKVEPPTPVDVPMPSSDGGRATAESKEPEVKLPIRTRRKFPSPDSGTSDRGTGRE